MKFSELRRAGFDTETTGVNVDEDRIVTAAIYVTGGGLADKTVTWLINPGVPIPDEAAEVHGVTTERAVAEGMDPKVALEEIASMLAEALDHRMPLVAYNLAFDWSILDAELRRHGLSTVRDRLQRDLATLLDPLVIDKAVDRYRKGSRKLGTVCEHYGIVLEDWHTADADATAAVRVMDAIVDQHPDLMDLTPAELMARQVEWARQQAESLQEYLRKGKDPDAVVDGSWPLRGAS